MSVDFPEVAAQLEAILLASTIPIEEIVGSGGGETKGTQRLRRALHEHGDGVARGSISHEVDHIARFPKGVIALEIEWNNKDPFFDRDLENYKRLHANGAISLGILVTRGTSLQDGLRGLLERFASERAIAGLDDLVKLGRRADAAAAGGLCAPDTRRHELRAGLGGVFHG